MIGQGKLGPDENKIIAVKNYHTPVTKKDVRAFLGLLGYYHQLILCHTSHQLPPHSLISQRRGSLIRSPNCENAFQKLKEALMQKPILSVAAPSRPFVLQTDASNQRLGAVLSQYGEDGCEHPVAYASHKLLPRETNMRSWRRNVWLSCGLSSCSMYIFMAKLSQ